MKTKKVLRDALFFLIISIFVSTQVFGLMPAYLELIGENQGRIEGSCEIEGREGTIVVYLFEHDVSFYVDPITGLPTDRLLTNPITVLKEFDKSSPKLHQALITGERLEFELKWYRIDPMSREEENYFTHKLEGAIITSIKPWMSNTLDPASQHLKHMENISFTYRDIRWTWDPDNTTGGGGSTGGGGDDGGQNYTQFDISLIKGWNLLSLPFLIPRYINQTIAPIKDDVDSIYTYKANDTGFEWKSYYPIKPGFLNTFAIFEPWSGYWIKVNKNTTLLVYEAFS